MTEKETVKAMQELDNMTRLARVEVSYEELAKCLHLPDGTRIISYSPSKKRGRMEFVVSSPELKKVPEGELIPECRYILHTEREEVVTKRWGEWSRNR